MCIFAAVAQRRAGTSSLIFRKWVEGQTFLLFLFSVSAKKKEEKKEKDNHNAVIISKNYFNKFQNPRQLSPPIVCGLFLSRDHLFGTNKGKGFNNRSSLSPTWFKFLKEVNYKPIICNRTLCACYENHSHQLKGKYDGWIMEQRLAARNRERERKTFSSGAKPHSRGEIPQEPWYDSI